MATTPETVDTLSTALRTGTRQDHEDAERSAFVEHLMGGTLPLAGYVDLAAQQHAVYRALEAAGDRLVAAGTHGDLVFPELVRVPAIEADLAHLLGDGWRTQVRVLPATADYVARLEAVGDDLPRYAAHAYTRYLGDLSGGQILKRMIERHHGLSGAGVSFYDFPQIHRLKPFKDVYRDRLDALPLTPTQREEVVAEARIAFRLNRAVFADLAAVHLG
ncbi:biliverdin-producing heme oxygenase [Cellulomonas sp. zg-ZUI222]|uniref:Biliverdin-producing heme oxygenase n=1 Tax=Cellulomonas wangleii TaxID=2816956 RepID=A0ABX8D7D1_9CELL|nr:MULTISPECIES: biliverdin-producing heme oxygenase [Cellulomonas]MBO0901522.1 biliverdin-producing heme oxygenase [Cellulomonas sp. zg-ZUI22]MBO0922359.1 biliverdin-producing heme oxygenase [Cellulomonas wangleii]MBO0926054.1 biliverdin-producing heme oxygenase [Cellulomonas wangleii]QVI63345.1 biliverdin-producing heme oxygenase [Cellulomonas wangleii]